LYCGKSVYVVFHIVRTVRHIEVLKRSLDFKEILKKNSAVSPDHKMHNDFKVYYPRKNMFLYYGKYGMFHSEGFEVLTVVGMKSYLFWKVTLSSPLKVKQHFGGKNSFSIPSGKEGTCFKITIFWDVIPCSLIDKTSVSEESSASICRVEEYAHVSHIAWFWFEFLVVLKKLFIAAIVNIWFRVWWYSSLLSYRNRSRHWLRPF
jgi:hypothetical protein